MNPQNYTLVGVDLAEEADSTVGILCEEKTVIARMRSPALLPYFHISAEEIRERIEELRAKHKEGE